MTRILCCLVLTCLATACAPRKATEVADVVAAPVTPPKRNPKPAVTATDPPPPDMPRVVNPDGMQLPDLTTKLPDRNDMTPTTTAPTGGGVIATPPRKPLNE